MGSFSVALELRRSASSGRYFWKYWVILYLESDAMFPACKPLTGTSSWLCWSVKKFMRANGLRFSMAQENSFNPPLSNHRPWTTLNVVRPWAVNYTSVRMSAITCPKVVLDEWEQHVMQSMTEIDVLAVQGVFSGIKHIPYFQLAQMIAENR